MNERQLRGVIRQILQEQERSRSLLEYDDDYGGGGDGEGGALYKAFVKPFVDVLGAAKLASQNILNDIKLVFKTLITISPKKLVEARKEWRTTKDSLDKEWDPIMKQAKQSVGNSDVGILAFSVAPNLFFANQIGKFATSAPSTVVDYFEKAGWEVPLRDWLAKAPEDRDPSDRSGGGGGRSRGADDGEDKGILKSIRTFFFGEGALGPDGEILTEDDKKGDDKKKKNVLTKGNINDEINAYFKETGFDKKLDELANQLVEAKKKHADSLLGAAKQQIDTLKAFAAAKDIPEFEKVLVSAKSTGADVEAIQKKIDELKKDIEKKAVDLGKDQKFREEVAKKAKDKKVTDEDMKKAIMDAANQASTQAVEDLKKSVSDSLKESFDQLKKQIREELMDDVPDKEDPMYKSFAASPRGKEILDIIDKAVNSIGPTGG